MQFRPVPEGWRDHPQRGEQTLCGAVCAGKEISRGYKVTDLLYACYNKAACGEDFSRELKEISGRYYEIIRGLELSLSLERSFSRSRKT